MIQPLRSAHRRVFIALAALLPAVLALGLSGRHPRMRPSIHVAQSSGSATLVMNSGTLWSTHTMQTAFYEDAKRPSDVMVVVDPARGLTEPDLLLYWSVEAPSNDSLPADARLLGPFFVENAFTLPLGTVRDGYLVLFSLPHGKVVDTARVKLP